MKRLTFAGLWPVLVGVLPACEYVLACMATAPDGRSHIEHDMIRHLSVR